MSKAAFVDRHVLAATADALTNLASDLPGLLSAADGLGVGGELAQLRAAPTWASETAVDLRARVGLVERLEHGQTTFAAFSVSSDELRQVAGGSMPVDEQLDTLEAAEKAKRLGNHDGLLDWDRSQDFSDWIEKVEARALTHLPLLGDKGELVQKGIHAGDSSYLSGRRTLFAPGTTFPWLRARAVNSIAKPQSSDVTEALGGGLDAVKDSKPNPGSWS